MEVRLKRDGMRRKGDTGAAEEEQQGVESFPEEERGKGEEGREERQRQSDNEKTRAGTMRTGRRPQMCKTQRGVIQEEREKGEKS